MAKLFSIYTPADLGAGKGTVTEVFAGPGEMSVSGQVLAVVETERERCEIRIEKPALIKWMIAKGATVEAGSQILAIEMADDVAPAHYALQAKDAEFPLRLLNIRPVDALLEKEDILLVLQDAKGRQIPCRPTVACRVTQARIPGDEIREGEIFCSIQPLGSATQLGTPSTLAYPLRVDDLFVTREDEIDAGMALCILKDAKGKRVRLPSPVSGFVTRLDLERGQEIASPQEVVRIRPEITPEGVYGITWRVRKKESAAPAPLRPSEMSRPAGARPAQTIGSSTFASSSATGQGKGSKVRLAVFGIALVLGIGGYAVSTDGSKQIAQLLERGDLEKLVARVTDRDIESANEAESSMDRLPTARFDLVDLTSLSNGRTPIPTPAQQHALEEFLRP